MQRLIAASLFAALLLTGRGGAAAALNHLSVHRPSWQGSVPYTYQEFSQSAPAVGCRMTYRSALERAIALYCAGLPQAIYMKRAGVRSRGVVGPSPSSSSSSARTEGS